MDRFSRGERERAHLGRSFRAVGGDEREDEVVPVENRRRSRAAESRPLELVRSGWKSSKQEKLALCSNESKDREEASGLRQKGNRS